MIYFDTAYMLKCYLDERGREQVRQTWHDTDGAACCEFGKMEFSSAIHRQFREQRITALEMHEILDTWRDDQDRELWNWLPLHETIIEEVTQMFVTLPPGIYLRAGDAIHLACARENGFTEIYSNDRHLKNAASHFGLVPRDVIS